MIEDLTWSIAEKWTYLDKLAIKIGHNIQS